MSTIIYYLGFVLLSIISLLSISREGKRYSHLLLVFVSIVMILFAGLRDGSPDQNSYRNIFDKVSPLDEVLVGNHNYDDVYGEWGYLFLNSLVKQFSNNDVVFFLVVAFLSIGIVAYACRRLSPYPLVSLLCYYSWFYNSDFGALRHALASSLILLMILMLVKSKKILAVSVYLSAISIHKVSVSAVIIWISQVMLKRRFLLGLILLASIAIAISGGIGTKIIEVIMPFTSGSVEFKLISYSLYEKWSGSAGFLRGVVLKQLLIILICFIYLDTLKNKFPAFPIVFGSYVLGLMFILLFHDFRIIADRFSNVLIISEIIIIPMLLSLFSGKEQLIAFLILICMLFYQVQLLVGNQFYAYKFIL